MSSGEPANGRSDSGCVASESVRRSGTLVVAGTGIEAIGHVTFAGEGAIRSADVVLFLVSDTLTIEWIVRLNPAAESLYPLYASADNRPTAYRLIVDRIMREVRSGRRVCALFYGHPGTAVTPGHAAVGVARLEGYSARMLPSVSALDCMICDLGVDLIASGFQSYEGSHLVAHPDLLNPACPLVVWQVSAVSGNSFTSGCYSSEGFTTLVELLLEIYGPEQSVVLYEAAVWAVCEPRIEIVQMQQLGTLVPTHASTLYVPAKGDEPLEAARVAATRRQPATAAGGFR
jgi:tetrapyrrole (corrin/porphyrin) methylase-like protein